MLFDESTNSYDREALKVILVFEIFPKFRKITYSYLRTHRTYSLYAGIYKRFEVTYEILLCSTRTVQDHFTVKAHIMHQPPYGGA